MSHRLILFVIFLLVQTVGDLWGGTLTVTFPGSGAGTVNSDPAGLSCASTDTSCSAPFADATSVTLFATPDWKSLDGIFGGGCTGTGSCTLTVSGDTGVTLTFPPNLQAALIITHPEIEPKFATLSDAYVYAVANGRDHFPLNARVHTFHEDLILTSPLTFTLAGGKDEGWYTRIGYTTLAGTLEVRSGTVTVDSLVIR